MTETTSENESRYRALLSLMSRLHLCESLDALGRALTEQITTVIPADLVTLNKIDLAGRMGGTITLFVPEIMPPSQIEPAFDRYVHQHPIVREMAQTGTGRPRRMSDLISVEEFRRLELYTEVFRPLKSLHQIGFSVTDVPGIVVGIGINRTADDFTNDELAFATLLWQHLPDAYHHVQLRELHARKPDLSGLDFTEREQEILLLLRAGLTNQQIADSLHAGRRTIEKHLERVYTKLGVRTRTAAVHTVWPPVHP